MKITTLDKLPINRTGKIQKIIANSSIKRRLFDLGLIEDTAITPVFKNPFGNPIAYEIRGTIIALRKEDICNIKVKY